MLYFNFKVYYFAFSHLQHPVISICTFEIFHTQNKAIFCAFQNWHSFNKQNARSGENSEESWQEQRFKIHETGWKAKIFSTIKVKRAWRETTPVCSRLTRLVRVGYSHHDHNSGASRERARITRHTQYGSIHMQRSLPSSSYPARSTLMSMCFYFSTHPG